MKILEISVENYKKLKVFYKKLNGDNLIIAGDTKQGKTTAVNVVWDIIEKVSDPLSHGEKKGFLQVKLGDSQKTILAKREFTEKSNIIKITTSDCETLTANEFKTFFSNLAKNPHKIMDLKPLEKTELLLDCVELPGNVNLGEMDEKREGFSQNRLYYTRLLKEKKEKTKIIPEKVKPIDISLKAKELDEIRQHNNKFDRAQEKLNRYEKDKENCNDNMKFYMNEIKELKAKIEKIKEEAIVIENNILICNRSIEEGQIWLNDKENQKKSLENIKKEIEDSNEINEKYIIWNQYKKDLKELEEVKTEYDNLNLIIKNIDEDKRKVLKEAKWPLPELSIIDNKIYYNNFLLDNLGTSEQLLICISLAAVLAKKSKVHAVCIDGIESMSKDDFKKSIEILNFHGVQALSTRVDRNNQIEDNEIMIVDGVFNEEVKNEINKKIDCSC